MTSAVSRPINLTLCTYSAVMYFLLSWKLVRVTGEKVQPSSGSNDPALECGLFMAESSNSGWGLYTGKHVADGDLIKPIDVAIQVVDRQRHMDLREEIGRQPVPKWNLDGHFWNSVSTSASWEADSIESIIPGLGMLAKSLPGLANVDNVGSKRRQTEGNNGAYTHFQEQTFVANGDIPAGHELFVDYGNAWHESHLENSDCQLADNSDGNITGDRNAVCSNDSLGMDSKASKSYAKNRVLGQYEQEITDSEKQKTISTSSQVIKSMNWLRQNGMCVDHIEPRPSTIPNAGIGAFAKRSLPKGTVVAPAPLVPLSRPQLDMLLVDSYDSTVVYWEGKQLLLNYVFGHPSTSLLFYPYSPAVNLINHNRQIPNVKLQWSSSHHPDLEQTVEQVIENPKMLLMEFVAIRDISPGEEILLDYGEQWQQAFDIHNHLQPSLDLSAWTLLQEPVLRTAADGLSYPSHIQTLCLVDYDKDKPINSQKTNGGLVKKFQWKRADAVGFDNAHVCHLSEHRLGTEKEILYTAKLNMDSDGTIVIRDIPAHAITLVEKSYSSPQFMRDSFRHEMQLPDEMIPPTWQDQLEEDSCGLYMAESAIPNSGLGMYTSREIRQNQQIYYGDLVINVEDIDVNLKLRGWYHDPNYRSHDPAWLLDSYYWNSDVTKAMHEADDVQSIVPGLGMLANSHTGLMNADFYSPQLTTDLHRQHDPGTGASTNYHNIRFLANQDIEAGGELLVEYGDDWFKDRAKVLGIIPLGDDFETADELLSSFWKFVDGNADSEIARDLWDLFLTPFSSKNRVRIALPNFLNEVEGFVHDGSARKSLKDRVRSLEWLEENGRCLDNIRPGSSTLDQAGRGAFATRFIAKGTVITPAPVIQLHRRHMDVLNSEDIQNRFARPWFEGKQLLLNYCYGHPTSSILLFPYAPVVNYVNHNATDFNANLRWSSMSNHHAEWLERSPRDLMYEPHAGLIMELVANRDILPGEEIFLNYGVGWDRAFHNFLSSWTPGEDDSSYVPASEYNKWLEWAELGDKAYENENVFTTCYMKDLDEGSGNTNEGYETTYKWKYSNGLYESMEYSRPCEIVERHIPADAEVRKDSVSPADVRYKCRIYADQTKQMHWIVENVPRRAIEVFEFDYRTDMFIRDAFRHEIWLPDEMVPDVWRDLKHDQRTY